MNMFPATLLASDKVLRISENTSSHIRQHALSHSTSQTPRDRREAHVRMSILLRAKCAKYERRFVGDEKRIWYGTFIVLFIVTYIDVMYALVTNYLYPL